MDAFSLAYEEHKKTLKENEELRQKLITLQQAQLQDKDKIVYLENDNARFRKQIADLTAKIKALRSSNVVSKARGLSETLETNIQSICNVKIQLDQIVQSLKDTEQPQPQAFSQISSSHASINNQGNNDHHISNNTVGKVNNGRTNNNNNHINTDNNSNNKYSILDRLFVDDDPQDESPPRPQPTISPIFAKKIPIFKGLDNRPLPTTTRARPELISKNNNKNNNSDSNSSSSAQDKNNKSSSPAAQKNPDTPQSAGESHALVTTNVAANTGGTNENLNDAEHAEKDEAEDEDEGKTITKPGCNLRRKIFNVVQDSEDDSRKSDAEKPAPSQQNNNISEHQKATLQNFIEVEETVEANKTNSTVEGSQHYNNISHGNILGDVVNAKKDHQAVQSQQKSFSDSHGNDVDGTERVDPHKEEAHAFIEKSKENTDNVNDTSKEEDPTHIEATQQVFQSSGSQEKDTSGHNDSNAHQEVNSNSQGDSQPIRTDDVVSHNRLLLVPTDENIISQSLVQSPSKGTQQLNGAIAANVSGTSATIATTVEREVGLKDELENLSFDQSRNDGPPKKRKKNPKKEANSVTVKLINAETKERTYYLVKKGVQFYKIMNNLSKKFNVPTSRIRLFLPNNSIILPDESPEFLLDPQKNSMDIVVRFVENELDLIEGRHFAHPDIS